MHKLESGNVRVDRTFLSDDFDLAYHCREDRRFSARFNNKVEKQASARPLPSTPLMPIPSKGD
jgi:hypothetical protein